MSSSPRQRKHFDAPFAEPRPLLVPSNSDASLSSMEDSRPTRYPVKDCHEMVQDSMGRIILLTNETKNNVIIYDKNCIFIIFADIHICES